MISVEQAQEAIFAELKKNNSQSQSVAMLICLRRYVVPALKIMDTGQCPHLRYGILRKMISFNKKFTLFKAVKVSYSDDGRIYVFPVEMNGLGDYLSLAKSDGFIELPRKKNIFLKERPILYTYGAAMNKLLDPHGRLIHKLRLSLLDACNFRCLYCMPEKVDFMSRHQFMGKSEIYDICKILVDFGINELRLTGGEPTLRADFLDIVHLLSDLKLKKFGLTSNGVKLSKILHDLRKTGLKNINFSLDSLNRKNFKKISRCDSLEEVLNSIFLAQELGFKVKINTVVMKGLNDFEVLDFVDFAGQYGIEVRFLEVMKIGVMIPIFDRYFISANQIMEKFKEESNPKLIPGPADSTSCTYQLSNGARIGFIASESKPFCSDCSRLRLGPNGQIYPCLMMDKGFSLRGKERGEIKEILLKTMGLKPTYRIEKFVKPMYQIGG